MRWSPREKFSGDNVYFRFAQVAIPIIFLGLLANLSGNIFWEVARTNFPELPGLTIHLIAGLIEPVYTKFIPALAIVGYLRIHKSDSVDGLSNRFVSIAVLFGFLVGAMEFVLYFLKGIWISLYIPFPFGQLATCRFPPILMHWLNGTLIGISVFSLLGYNQEDRITILGRDVGDRLVFTIVAAVVALAMAQIIHVWWNTGGNEFVSTFIGISC